MAATGNTEDEIKRLRDQIALLISKNLDLQRRLDEFEREKAGLTVESIGASLVGAIRSAEAAMAEEAGEDRRYVISELQASLRGFLSRQDNDLTLRLPRPEQTVPPDNLGNLQVTLKSVPPRILPESVIALATELETAQLTFASLLEKSGGSETSPAQEIVAWSSHLLANLSQWREESFAQAAHAMAAAAVRLSESLPQRTPSNAAEQYRAAARGLVELTQNMKRSCRATIEDVMNLATSLRNFTHQHRAIVRM